MKKAEYKGNLGCRPEDRVEPEDNGGARSIVKREAREKDGAVDLMEVFLDRDNLNRAYKKVKSNGGAAGVDGMKVEDMLPWLREHREELLKSLRNGTYKPQPVRRVEIPKPDGGVRKLGVPTVIDRMVQQALVQILQPIFEPLFSEVPEKRSHGGWSEIQDGGRQPAGRPVVYTRSPESGGTRTGKLQTVP